jgi:MoaA/NifB/PqqE/SkfB family radical SAM enzyme
MISQEIEAEYQASRRADTDRSVLCHAPFISLNFDQSGNVTACCYNRDFVLGKYPEQSVHEIWTGPRVRELRDAFLNGTEAQGCDLCFRQLKSRNFAGVLMRNFDGYATAGYRNGKVAAETPLMLEFEISNTCHLECVMCGGHWSSAIRARREKLPPLHNPYDHNFVKQIEQFVPSLVGAKFLGGEPFLIKRYHEIWDSFRRLNPEAPLWITTSAAEIPERPREMIEHIRAHFSVSIDAITPATYEAIRVNASFDKVMQNIEYLLAYTRRRNTSLGFTICPMTYNWVELPAIMEFCEARQINVHFNTVTRPSEASLASLSGRELKKILNYLEERTRDCIASWLPTNRGQWASLNNQLRAWLDEKDASTPSYVLIADEVQSLVDERNLGGKVDPVGVFFGNVMPLLDNLLVAYRFESERIQVPYSREPPPFFRKLHEQGNAQNILSAAYLLWRFVDLAGRDKVGSAGLGTGLDIDAIYDDYLRIHSIWGTSQSAAATRREQLGTWALKSACRGEVHAILEVLRRMLKAPEDSISVPVVGVSEMRRRLNSTWVQFGLNTLGDPARTSIEEYLGSLLALDPEPEHPQEFTWRIRNLADLDAGLHASNIFRRWMATDEDYAAFSARFARIRELMIATSIDSSAIPSDMDVRQLCAFLSYASDEQFTEVVQSAVEQLSARPLA